MTRHTGTGSHDQGRGGARVGLLRTRCDVTRRIAAGAGAALMLIPVGAAWPDASVLDALAPPAVFDWARVSLGWIVVLRRKPGGRRGDRQ